MVLLLEDIIHSIKWVQKPLLCGTKVVGGAATVAGLLVPGATILCSVGCGISLAADGYSKHKDSKTKKKMSLHF